MKKLRKLRRDAGMTQHALARAAGIHCWRISHAEQGILVLAKEEMTSIRKALLDRVRERNKTIEDDLSREEIGRNTRLRSATA